MRITLQMNGLSRARVSPVLGDGPLLHGWERHLDNCNELSLEALDNVCGAGIGPVSGLSGLKHSPSINPVSGGSKGSGTFDGGGQLGTDYGGDSGGSGGGAGGTGGYKGDDNYLRPF